MAQKSQWSTIEGGITNTFPLSLNRTTYWTALRKGECYYQDMVKRDQRGILTYQQKPTPSPECFVRRIDPEINNPPAIISQVSHYSRIWTVSGVELKYSDIGATSPGNKTIKFDDDSEEPIKLVGFAPNGTIYIAKNNCAYTLTNTNIAPDNWVRSSPDYSIGTDLIELHATNAIYGSSILLAFKGRHYLWNGEDTPVELSADVRELAANEGATSGLVNWPEELLIFNNLVYDFKEKRVFYYSGKTTASMTTRPYYAPDYRPLTIYRLAFICDGNVGSFDAVVEYGQSVDSLSKTKTFKVNIRTNSKVRFRHTWILDIPIVCRVWRIRIENLTGVGVAQIDVDSSIADTPDAADGTE